MPTRRKPFSIVPPQLLRCGLAVRQEFVCYFCPYSSSFLFFKCQPRIFGVHESAVSMCLASW
ncbi:hypothetical protein HMPREF3226_02183 [Prevotella corporis]|uniref:Uncharacterized protein n=1 Tax=Prevotella corporis TaxID=28128 RepID=A0A133PXH4_9BACT|nr:hypothetical protein HMPREF3226_02183 [Prevotella corporis]